ncbi:hypothetical protein COT44_04470 [Candidatus Shapirobacteria bacterium CG08_land_8_20_14_0_20_39_18]|uniref:Amidophosphoribosyltransferase n=1 Tax=Candidatus Shapirobacteria bacterium CG08_land_8_20_14_0_20_39_18 TaxID=1974883 RepID=A0A2M6XBS9_9BACT|nr:MAG: hypothetical protein COT44_04470 [Candidatus Shapirobacteria bacterium CG08_land_8_20_14_0_20_39_18]PIY65313.1 MAG: hypothetical protein COY91_02760 [Candidatus Shapirobacteria bacterium CG_4_10_14_0_8_um_filter_39_15]
MKILYSNKIYIDHPHEECGVFGIFFPHPDFSNTIVTSTLSGLLALQHRGEESAGIVVGDGRKLSAVFKRMGLVRNLYNTYLESEENIKQNLKGYLAVSHTRYSTTGSSSLKNAAPFLFDSPKGSFAVAHNGNITNAPQLKEILVKKRFSFSSTTDSEIIGSLILSLPGKSLITKIEKCLPVLEGSFCLIFATKNSIIAIRDKYGNRPLSYAEFTQDKITGYAISSESSAFNNLEISYKREVKPGEMIIFNKLRRNLGKKLVELYPPPKTIDFVTYIAESAKSASEGFTQGLSELWGKPIDLKTSMLKNRYGSINGAIRGFINPNHETRKEVANGNYHPFDIVQGKEIAIVDDSIIRGTTTRGVVQTIRRRIGDLRNGGAKKIHLRIIFPPVIGYCPLGTDINDSDKLIAKEMVKINQVAKSLEVDSLNYLSVEEFSQVVNETVKKEYGLCLGCATGKYPVSSFTANKNKFD